MKGARPILGLFWYSPIPIYAVPSRNGQPAFFLEGETDEDLAWDLVDMFFDGFMTQNHLRGLAKSDLAGGMGLIMDDSEFDANMTRTMRYHDERFTEAWWRKKQWMISDLLGGERVMGMTHSRFDLHFPPETLLLMHLTVMIGRYYSQHHGYPEEPLTPRVAIEYFAKHGYLKWLPEDAASRQRILAGDLSPLY